MHQLNLPSNFFKLKFNVLTFCILCAVYTYRQHVTWHSGALYFWPASSPSDPWRCSNLSGRKLWVPKGVPCSLAPASLEDPKNLSNFDLSRKWHVRCSARAYGPFHGGCLYTIKLFVHKSSYIFSYIFSQPGKLVDVNAKPLVKVVYL